MEGSNQQESVSFQRKYPAVFRWMLILGLMIVVNLFVAYATDVIYKMPEFETYCPQEQVMIVPKTQDECIAKGGQWVEGGFVSGEEGMTLPIKPEGSSYCNATFTCQKGFENATSLYNRNVFVVYVIVGIALLIGSYFIRISGVVSLGLSFGGILALVVGSIRYWADMNEYIRVIVLGIALVVLIWFGIKKFRD